MPWSPLAAACALDRRANGVVCRVASSRLGRVGSEFATSPISLSKIGIVLAGLKSPISVATPRTAGHLGLRPSARRTP
jgi:hypothetical protein